MPLRPCPKTSTLLTFSIRREGSQEDFIVPGSPNVVIYSDYFRPEQGDKGLLCSVSKCQKPTLAAIAYLLPAEPVSSVNLSLKTLFANHTLQAEIVREKVTVPFPGHKKSYIVRSRVSVNHQPVLILDIVGLNGAAHAIGKLLDPRASHHLPTVDSCGNEDKWAEWEEWLPQWADENV